MVDALNCAQGCLYGTGIEPQKSANDDILYEIQRIKASSKKKKAGSPWKENSSHKQRLAALNRQFRQLNPNDFARKYTDLSAGNVIQRPNTQELEAIFQSLNKIVPSSARLTVAPVVTLPVRIWHVQFTTAAMFHRTVFIM